MQQTTVEYFKLRGHWIQFRQNSAVTELQGLGWCSNSRSIRKLCKYRRNPFRYRVHIILTGRALSVNQNRLLPTNALCWENAGIFFTLMHLAFAFFMWIDRTSWIMCIITNSMLCLFLVYWIKIPLHVSGVNSPSSGGKVYVCGKWYY
jgi:hypothetical protein